ncbi:GntR family transcriptional regulator [Jiangella alkaliphila]|uniref:DNA-binding transcriptional regulator YhcF, GntR family n=1 Tax=Jiangella alkaliphila TaxID=419479 RepID=A0A1H2GCL8_9ACTN|nr:winged helix-turn-helix domain-containing protein [Jiangella alkaliphila]SDU17403.1 DNA-binding transcriptional regulator YhcF, GntR family [Jiangella alkaliphila]
MTVADEFDPDEDRPGYKLVHLADHLTAKIADGRLSAGARLPSQRDMAAEYRVSTNTIVRALDVLRERGLIVTFRYKGTYVVEDPAPLLEPLDGTEGEESTS